MRPGGRRSECPDLGEPPDGVVVLPADGGLPGGRRLRGDVVDVVGECGGVAGQYESLASDGLEIVWGDAAGVVELLGCGGAAAGKVYDGTNICTRDRDAWLNDALNGKDAFFANPVSGTSCLRRISDATSDKRFLVTKDFDTASPAGSQCEIAGATSGAFLNAPTANASTLFAMPAAGQSFRVNWNTGEPNNGLNMYEEDCVVMSGATAGKWDDRPCAAGPPIAGTYGFVCERD